MQNNFSGYRVVAFESRYAEEMRKSLEKQEASALVAPSMREVPLESTAEVENFAKRLLKNEVQILICMTGVGAKILLDTLMLKNPREKIIQAINRLTVVARGPKSVAVLEKFGIAITIKIPEPNTWREIIEELDYSRLGVELKGKTVAIQEYGVSNDELMSALKKRGANILRVPVYRWALPENREPLESAIREIAQEKIQFAMFTSANQVHHVIRVASEMGLEHSLRDALGKIVICSVGPTTTETLLQHGLQVDFEPTHPKMGHLIIESAKQARELYERRIHGVRPSIELKEKRPSNKEDYASCHESVFLKACRREKTEYTPVWLMRQAGR